MSADGECTLRKETPGRHQKQPALGRIGPLDCVRCFLRNCGGKECPKTDCEQAGLFILQKSRSPQVEACPIISPTFKLFTFELIDRYFAGE